MIFNKITRSIVRDFILVFNKYKNKKNIFLSLGNIFQNKLLKNIFFYFYNSESKKDYVNNDLQLRQNFLISKEKGITEKSNVEKKNNIKNNVILNNDFFMRMTNKVKYNVLVNSDGLYILMYRNIVCCSQDIILFYFRLINSKTIVQDNNSLKSTSNFIVARHNALSNTNYLFNKKIQRKDKSVYQLSNGKEVNNNLFRDYCENINEKVKKNTVDCLIARDKEIHRTIIILCRRKKNNVLLIGESGVGKTAIAEGLATRIVKKQVPIFLKDSIVYSLDIISLIAGTKFRGEFEERLKKLLAVIKGDPNIILFIDEIHNIIGAGATINHNIDASNLLKPALAKGEIKCIGATTFKDFQTHFEHDIALGRRFQKVIVHEPDINTTLTIVKGLKPYYENYHNVLYSDSAITAAVNLSYRYIYYRALPDKAIDLIDEAGAKKKLESHNGTTIILEKDIKEVLSSTLNIPILTLQSEDINEIKFLEKNLQNCILGQEEAISHICSSIKLSKSGLKNSNKPIGCYMFVGSVGVGKSELAKQLASFLNMKLLKYDMTYFGSSSSITKIIGSSPGYVGYNHGGTLATEVSKYPYSVLLLEKIEQASSDVLNIISQIIGDGMLEDSTGRLVNFSHCIIILIPSSYIYNNKIAIGFNNEINKSNNLYSLTYTKKIRSFKEYFPEQLLCKLDNLIFFNPIDKVITKIVVRQLNELKKQLLEKNVTLCDKQSVRKYLENYCLNNNVGVLELNSIIDLEIKQKIADEILFGKLVNGGMVVLFFSKKRSKFIFKYII